MSQSEIINNPAAFFADRNKLATATEFVIFYRSLIDSAGNREGNKP